MYPTLHDKNIVILCVKLINDLLFSYIQTQQYTMEIILNSQFLFQDVAVMLSGAVACLITVPVSIGCIIRQIHRTDSEEKSEVI